jgi:hypothetical protein
MDYRQIYAKQKSAEQRIIKAFGDPTSASGIYIFERYNSEKGKVCYYIGQAKSLLRRIAQHLLEHDHIAVSLKKYGLASGENPCGWHCEWKYCEVDQLDCLEKITIDLFNNDLNELYNITSGGQGQGKIDINQRKEPKGYGKGRDYGYNKALKEIAKMVDKYTTGLTSKGGKTADRKTNELLAKLKGVSE